MIKKGYDIIGFPHLVRLNPNIPWKTRGNGATCFRIGKGFGEKKRIGFFKNNEIFSYKKESDYKFSKDEIQDIFEILDKTIKNIARLEEDNTNSGFVLLKDKPDNSIYFKSVRKILELPDIIKNLENKSLKFKGYKNKRGLIGAFSSIAWDYKSDCTFELISYREENKRGKNRIIDNKGAIEIDKKISSTFDNFDYKNKHNRLFPSSPCPVLFGIRGEDPDLLLKSKDMIKSENIESWILFRSNQGTDDHLLKKKIKNTEAYDSVIISGTVDSKPQTIKGGHVFFSLKDDTGRIDCASYEPTKEFRKLIRKLAIGDFVEVYGGVRENPLTINLEKIRIINLERVFEKIENPVCPKCGKHMKSKGKDEGYKCVKCSITNDKPVISQKKRDIKIGFYEVPVCARRHLSKPIKRMKERIP